MKLGTADFMAVQWVHLKWDFIDCVVYRIMNKVSGVSQAVYDISSKPSATIECSGGGRMVRFK